MTTIRVPSPLRIYTQGEKEIMTDQDQVDRAIEELVNRYPGLRPHLFDSNGALRTYVNLFVNDSDIRTLEGLQTKLADRDQLLILPSIAGGRSQSTAGMMLDPGARSLLPG